MMGKNAGKAKALMSKCGYASGGSVPAMARGGGAKSRHHAKHTTVNVVIPQSASAAPPRPPMPMGMPPRPPMGAGAPPPGAMPPPGLAGPGPGGPPPGLAGGLPPGVRPPGMKRGGGIDAGGGGAKGRLEKIKAYGG